MDGGRKRDNGIYENGAWQTNMGAYPSGYEKLMAGRRCGSEPYGCNGCRISCILSDGRPDRTALSGMRHDALPFFSYDGQNQAVCVDAPDGHSGCLSFFLLFMESLYTGKTRKRNEVSDCGSDYSAGRSVLCADVSLFPGQRAIYL